MIKKVELYCFSPTGGTKKAGEAFANSLAEEVKYIDLLDKNTQQLNADCELIVAAVPVFAGRIPTIASEKLQTLQGEGKKAVALVVYGIRAYEDALLELTEVLADCGFDVVAAGAFNAQHSMMAEVGTGRPDAQDLAELQDFAAKTLEKLMLDETASYTTVNVPGNHPYKDAMVVANTPISNEACVACGACAEICPTEAIVLTDGKVETELAKCIDCMACTAVCPVKARTLSPAHQAGIHQRLGALKDVRRENEIYL